MARAVCHAQGRKHLLDPGKLWEGSLKTLKEMALAYGPIDPVPEDRLIGHTDFSLPGLTILETPGHAPHHLSFDYQGKLFAGEGAGVYLPFWEGPYLRPPTPPRFFFDQAVASVDHMLALADRPIFFAHLGAFPHSREILREYRKQLYRWLECYPAGPGVPPRRSVGSGGRSAVESGPLSKKFPIPWMRRPSSESAPSCKTAWPALPGICALYSSWFHRMAWSTYRPKEPKPGGSFTIH